MGGRVTGSVFVSTGEPSGDLYGALLTRALRGRAPRLRVEGFGGDRMRAAGARAGDQTYRGQIMGWTAAARHAASFLRLLASCRRSWARRPPAALVCVDFPGFNLRLARLAHDMGIPAYYFVCPQVWAWGAQRLLVMRRTLRRAFPVLPFEEGLYHAFGVPATFPGHPLLELLPASRPSRMPALRRAGLDPHRPVAVLLPGSRDEEVARHLPLFLDARRALGAAGARYQWAAIATVRTAAAIERLLGAEGSPAVLRAVRDPAFGVRANAAFAWTASGTATLELGLLGVPQAVAYRAGALNMWIARRLVRVPHISLVNLILERGTVPEFLQEAATPSALAAATRRKLLGGLPRARREAAQLRAALDRGRASVRVADELVRDLEALGRA